MAKNVIINGVTYNNVPYVNIPLAEGSGNAKFVDTDSGDASATDLRAGKKAWVDGAEITGTAADIDEITVSSDHLMYSVPAGFVPTAISETIDRASVYGTGEWKFDDEPYMSLSTETDYPVDIAISYGVEQDGYIKGTDSHGVIFKTAYVQVEDKTVTPSASAQDITPSSGKLMKKVHVNAVDVSATATEADVLAGKTFFSGGSLTRKTGTATVPTVAYNSVTKVLTVS